MENKDKELMKGDKYKSKGDMRSAEKCYLRSIESKPSFWAYMGLGDVYTADGKYDDAIDNYRKAIEIDDGITGDVIKAYHRLGRAYLSNSQIRESLDTFKACSHLHGTYVKQITDGIRSETMSGMELSLCILDSRLWVARLSTDPEEKIKYYEDPMSLGVPMLQAEDYISLSRCYGHQGKVDKWQETVRKGYEKFPDDVDMMYSYSLQLKFGDPEALPLLLKIAAREDTDPSELFDYGTIYNNIAAEYTHAEKYAEALPYAEKAVAKSPEHYYCWMSLGKTYLYLGRYNDSVNALTKGLECGDCEYPHLLFSLRGQAYIGLGEKEKGEADLERAAQSAREMDDIEKQIKDIAEPEEDITDAEKQYQMGCKYYAGDGVPQDYAKAAVWLRKAAEQGHAWAQHDLGECYYWGHGVEQDFSEAAKWYLRAAEQGDNLAQNNIGECYYYGIGIEQDFFEAAKWYKKAAAQGRPIPQHMLGECYYWGKGVQQDYTKAVEWYSKSAVQGHDLAQYSLGLCYYEGKGVDQDYAKAVEWFSKSAAQGNADAMCLLGFCYEYGYGVTRDYDMAAEWTTKAAMRGNADAQFNLGCYYYKGQGVPRDYDKALEWWKKAADQGHELAIDNLNNLQE